MRRYAGVVLDGALVDRSDAHAYNPLGDRAR
jgi:hypothetical protein